MDTTTQERNLAQYLEEIGLTAKVVEDWNDDAPSAFASMRNARHYQVTLKFQGRSMRLWFYTGSAHATPTAEDVIYSLDSDRWYAEAGLGDFADCFGWSADTVPTYKQLVNLNKRYAHLIGSTEQLDKIGEVANV